MKNTYDWPLQLTEILYPVCAHVKETCNHQTQLVLKTETQHLTFCCQKRTTASVQCDAEKTEHYVESSAKKTQSNGRAAF
jgi:hypothetical protein